MKKTRPEPEGYLAIVLHAHLPFVRHMEFEDFLEERWLQEAVVESYLPLIQRFMRLREDGVEFRFTLSISPTLISMLEDSLLRARMRRHLDHLVSFGESELIRNRDKPELLALSRFHLERFSQMRELYDDLSGDILAPLATLEAEGFLELITAPATHAVLPLVACHPPSIRAQVRQGIQSHEKALGRKPRGMWLPECAYYPGLDEVLAEEGIRFFFLDAHGVTLAKPKPVFAVYAPIYTPAGVTAFGRDTVASRRVWSIQEGYSGHRAYRDFHSDVGYELPCETVSELLPPDDARCFTGYKYHARGSQSLPAPLYQPDLALKKARQHAADFVLGRESMLPTLAEKMRRPPLFTVPFDAELFGHWWFEGPDFLDSLARRIFHDTRRLTLVTPMEYLHRYPANQKSEPAASSWGEGGQFDSWANDANDWAYPHVHEIATRMTELADFFPETSGDRCRALNQCAREVLLAQSSDWTFQIQDPRTRPYAEQRIRNHVGRFLRLYEMLVNDKIDTAWLTQLEEHDLLFPDIDYTVYCS